MILKVLLLSIYFGLCADSKNWYLANDNDNGFHRNVLNYPPYNEFKPSDPSEVSIFKNEPRIEQIKKVRIKPNGSLELNNKIENINIYNINGQKRNKLRKCPQIRRKAKTFNVNATSEGRFLEIFQVVQFDHDSCSSDTGFEGHCLHEYDCYKSGGTPMGTCADGHGTCCVVLFNCEGRSSAPIGWLNNPGYPSSSTERLSCTFTLDIISADIKQIRLDLMHFELLPPTFGNCELDQFSVTGQNVNNLVPILCGINTGQHVYIEVSGGPLILSLQSVTAEDRLFSIKITQLTSSDDLAAPTGCLQYFKEDHGHIESFNYRDTTEIGIARSPSYLIGDGCCILPRCIEFDMLIGMSSPLTGNKFLDSVMGVITNLNYAMCIERAPASCSVTYTNSGAMQIVNYDNDGSPVIPPQQAGVEVLNCPSDWLLIAALRLCGERLNDGSVLQDFTLNAPVTDDAAGPIVIWFRSDDVYTGRGFRIYYQQNPCTT